MECEVHSYEMKQFHSLSSRMQECKWCHHETDCAPSSTWQPMKQQCDAAKANVRKNLENNNMMHPMIKPMLLGGAYLTKYRRLMPTERNFVLWAPSSICSECVMNSLHIFLEHCPFFMTYKKEMFSRSQKRFIESNWDVTSLSEFDMNYLSHSEHYIANFHDFWKGNF